MASFVSVLDQLDISDEDHIGVPPRLRDCLRFLRHVESVEISGISRNWDAKKCFVLLVTVNDDEVRDDDDTNTAGLQVVKPVAPFQVERTQKELRLLQSTMRQWCIKHSNQDATENACKFCVPIARGDLALAVKQSLQPSFIHGTKPSKSRGLIASWFRSDPTLLKTGDEWEAWLNASIADMRRLDVSADTLCGGICHVPPLLARFLLQEFASDVIH